MATDNDDVLLDEDGDDLIANGDFSLGDGSMDDCSIIFRLNTASLKSDPILAPNLILLMNSKSGSVGMEQALRINLERDKKKYKKLAVNKGHIDFEI